MCKKRGLVPAERFLFARIRDFIFCGASGKKFVVFYLWIDTCEFYFYWV